MGVLDKLFQGSRRSAWRQFSDQVDGQFVDGGLFQSDKILVPLGNRTITIDTEKRHEDAYDTPDQFIRIRCPFKSKDGFQITAWLHNPTGIISLAKVLGMQDIEIGDERFDRKFIVQSNDPEKARVLLLDYGLRALVEHSSSWHLEITEKEDWYQPIAYVKTNDLEAQYRVSRENRVRNQPSPLPKGV